MQRFLALSLAIMVLFFSACAGDSGSDTVSSENAADVLSASNSASQPVESETSDLPTSATDAEPSNTVPDAVSVSASASGEKMMTTVRSEGVVSSGERTDRYFSDGLATLSWRAAYESFYSGGVTLTPAIIDEVWQSRYDHFDYATHIETGAIILRSDAGVDFIYPMFEMPFAAIDTITANGSTGGIAKKCAQNSGYYGFLTSYKADNSFAGEGEVVLTPDSSLPKAARFLGFNQGEYGERTSMTITEGIEAQLLDYGFSPETTQAFSLTFNKNYYGVCFYDEAKAVYYNSSVIFSKVLKPQIYSFEELGGLLNKIHGVDSVLDIADDAQAPYDGLPESELQVANPACAKPVIYLYPEQPTNVAVTLGYPSEYLTYTYPLYQDGWRVRAEPNGTLTNLKDGSQHYYLFWEGDKKVDWDLSEGFVIKGSDTEAFLREKLAYMGLTPREYNDFITYWAPEMCRNPYNLIRFSTEQYEALAPLSVTPAPDSMLRVHMVYKGLEQPVKVFTQTLVPWQRTGFAVVEWGGSRA